MNQLDILNAQRIRDGFESYEQNISVLVGIGNPEKRETLIKQFVESLRRIRYITRIAERNVGSHRADPHDPRFDPEWAASYYKHQGNLDEAFWLVFLSVHFGKNIRTEWRYVRDIYSSLEQGVPWNWSRISDDPHLFRQWLSENMATLRGGDGIKRNFGNHRKYQSLHPYSANGTGEAVESYVSWVARFGSHAQLIRDATDSTDATPRAMFDYLYCSMGTVATFGRTARFDYLTMIGKLGLASIEPGSTYMHGATGPFSGARLLFGSEQTINMSRTNLDRKLIELESYLNVGMQAMEDALCNWQKSPAVFRAFRG